MPLAGAFIRPVWTPGWLAGWLVRPADKHKFAQVKVIKFLSHGPAPAPVEQRSH